MVSKDHKLSVRRQCALLTLARSNMYYEPKGEAPENLQFMAIIDKQFLETPWYGSRQMARHMKRINHACGRHRVRRLMRLMRSVPIYQEPNTSKKHPQHKIWPYLLRKLSITRPNHVWCSDITYIPVKNGFLYLVAIMDWATRKVLSWRLSNTLDASFCVEALDEAIAKYGKPEIMNTDQGSQYTGADWIKTLTKDDIKISMDGRGRYLDNIFIERLWRSLKQEAVYLHEITDGFQAKRIIDDWIAFYNSERPHTALDKRTPDAAYFEQSETRKAALKFLRKTMKRHGNPNSLVTGRLRSYGAAMKVIGSADKQETGRWFNNRAENSHQPFRRRERAMIRFRRMRTLQKFVSVHSSVHNHFNQERQLYSRENFKLNRAAALAEWRQLGMA